MGAEDDLMAVDRGKDEITERAQSVCITLLWQGISGVSAQRQGAWKGRPANDN